MMQPTDEAQALAITLLIFFVSTALIVSFLCSVAETVLLSITPAYIENLRKEHPKRAAKLQRLRQDNIDRSLAAILTMNTIAHTVGAIEAGAQSAIAFGSAWVGFFSVIMTLLILFFSEIIPKTLGAVYWPRLVGVTQVYISGLIFMLLPLVKASEVITKLIAKNKSIHAFSRDEFLALAGLGEKAGEIDPQESKIIHNLFRFRSLQVTDIMTPRPVVCSLNHKMSIEEAQQKVASEPFSRILLYRESQDEVIGFALKDEILMYSLDASVQPTLQFFRREIQAVPISMRLPPLLEFLLETRQHIVMVVDEYGVMKGIVTLEDVIETLLGMEIIDEMDDVTDMQALARQQWARRAKALGLELTEPEVRPFVPDTESPADSETNSEPLDTESQTTSDAATDTTADTADSGTTDKATKDTTDKS